MFEYTENNHFKFGYNGLEYNTRQNENDKFWAGYGTVSRNVGTFKEECFRVAKLIKDRVDALSLPVDVLYSGGSDSEVMLRSFIEQDIPVNVNVVEFADNLNLQDVGCAYKFCDANGIKPIIHKLDIEEFLESEAFEYADLSSCPTPQMLLFLWLYDQVEGVPVLGYNTNVVHRDFSKYWKWDLKTMTVIENKIKEYPKVPWYVKRNERHMSIFRYPMLKQKPAVPGFFIYTPEILLSFLHHPWTKHLAECGEWGEIDVELSKKKIYEEGFPDIVQERKQTGFENIMHLDLKCRTVLMQKYGHCNQVHSWEYNDLVSHLGGETA